MNHRRVVLILICIVSLTIAVEAWGVELMYRFVRAQETSGGFDATLFVNSSFLSMVFTVDDDDDESLGVSPPHQFIWQRDVSGVAITADERMMQLQSSDTGLDDGDLLLDGQLSTNSSFDLAQTFRAGETLEPGDLVRVDESRGDRVFRTRTANDRLAIGVVSKNPGVVLGGVPFSVESLRRVWGDDAVAAFERQRAAIEFEVLAQGGQRPDLERLEQPERAAVELAFHDEVLRRFFWRHFTPIALSGRVRVKADASFGQIRPGDPLTASPVPGTAMKASSGATIGIALEGLSQGTGRILTLVQRGWYPGEAARLANVNEPFKPELESDELEVSILTQRVAELEQLVASLSGAETGIPSHRQVGPQRSGAR